MNKKQQVQQNWFDTIANNKTKAKRAIIITCVLLYIRILSFGLVHFDDYGFVLWGTDMLKLSNIPAFFTHNTFWVLGDRYKYADVFYRPLQNVVYAICNTLWSKHTLFYHLAGLLLHISTSLALFNFLRELNYKNIICFAFTMLFAVHPVLVEGVAWIGGIGDQLVTVFALLSVTYFIKLTKAEGAFNPKYFALHFITLLGALYSKEIAVGIIPMCLVYFFAVSKGKLSNKLIWQLAIGWLILVSMYIVMRNHAIPKSGNSIIHAAIESMRLNGFIVFEYIQKSFLPYNLSTVISRSDAHFVLGALLVIAVTLFFVIKKRFTSLALFGLIWFLLFLLPTFIQLYTQLFYEIEHRLYLPIAGLLILIIELLQLTNINFNSKTFKYSFITMVLVFFFIGFGYSNSYRNASAFFDNALARSPNLVIAYNNYAEVELDSAKYQKAIDYYKKSFELEKDINTSGKIGDIYNRNLNDPLQAINWFKITYSIDTTNIPAAGSIASIYLETIHDTLNAQLWYDKVLKIEPGNSVALDGLSNIYLGKGNITEARKILLQVLNINPKDLPAIQSMAISYYKQGDMNGALDYLNKGYQYYPDNADLQKNMIICYYRSNDYTHTQQIADLYLKNNNDLPAEIMTFLQNGATNKK